MNWQLQIRKGRDIVAAFFPLSDQEHIRVVLREGYSFWKRYYEDSGYVGIDGVWQEWKQLSFIPGHYVIILGYNDCAINTDTQHEELLKKAEVGTILTLNGREFNLPKGVEVHSEHGKLILRGPLELWGNLSVELSKNLDNFFEYGCIIPEEWTWSRRFSVISKSHNWSVTSK